MSLMKSIRAPKPADDVLKSDEKKCLPLHPSEQAGKRRSHHFLPWMLIVIGTAVSLFALYMILQTPEMLQYCIISPPADEDGKAVRKALVNSGHELMTASQDAYNGFCINGMCSSIQVGSGAQNVTATLHAVSEGWMEVYPRTIIDGRRISETELKNGERWIMLDESLAFALFGSELPQSASVQLNNITYRVTGTVRHAGGLFGRRDVADVEPYDCYIPLIAAINDDLYMDVMMLSALPASKGSVRVFEADADRWQEGGTMIDLQKERIRASMILRFILMIVGIYIMYGLFRRMTSFARRLIDAFRQRLGNQYMSRLLPKLVAMIIIIVAGYGALIGLSWMLLSFSVQPLYIFTEYVPDKIAEWSSIRSTFWNAVEMSSNLVRIGSRELCAVEFWGRLIRFGCITILLGAAMKVRNRRALTW